MPSTTPDFWYEMGDAIKAELQAQPEGQKKRPLNQRTIQEMLPPKKRVRGAGSSTDPIEFEEDDLVSGDQKKADQEKGGCPPGDLKAKLKVNQKGGSKDGPKGGPEKAKLKVDQKGGSKDGLKDGPKGGPEKARPKPKGGMKV